LGSRRRSSSPSAPTGRWIHLFEEDSPGGAVYAPDDADIPLSRRPRDGIELHRDGSAVLYRPGPDDRLVEVAARWTAEGGTLTLHPADGSAPRQIIQISPSRLVLSVVTESRSQLMRKKT